jgi:cytochrome c-type biogenesis protein CcmH
MKQLMVIFALVGTLMLGGALTGVLTVSPAWAVQPDEVLDDPELEARARELSKGLRCLVCRNESIDESNADLARDLRLLVRERLVAGDSDVQAVAFIVDRYGEYVLLRPTTAGSNWLLWAAGPLMLLAAVAMGGAYLRGRARPDTPQDNALSPEEQERLHKILGD